MRNNDRLIDSYVRRIVAEAVDTDKKFSKVDYDRVAHELVSKYGKTTEVGWEVVAVKTFVKAEHSVGNEWDEKKLVDAVRKCHEENMEAVADANVQRIY
jgi:hypothetical protein